MYFSLFFLFNVAKFLTNKNFQFNENYLFNEISNQQLDLISKLNLTQIPTKLEFETKTSTKKNAILQNYYFTNNNFRKVRLSFFKSDDTQMFSSVWYPSYDYDCPILTIDLVNFKKDVSLCFVNLVEVYNNVQYLDTYIKPLIEIKKNYPELSESRTIHLKALNDVLSDSMLYGHIYNNSKFNTTIPKVLDEYFESYTKKFIKKPVNRFYIEEKHTFYNKIRAKLDSNFIMKDYYDAEWFKRLIDEYYLYN